MTVTGSGLSLFTFTPPNLVGTILAKPLEVFSASVTPGRIYNGTTAATVTGGILMGNSTGPADGKYIGTENVLLANTSTGSYASKNVGTWTVTTSMTLAGTDAGNYVLNQPSLTGTITAKDVTMNATTANKEYDGTTAATVTLGTLAGLVGSEQLQVSVGGGTGTGTFSSADVGGSGTVSVTYVLADDLASGGLAGNYNLTNPTESISGSITRRTLTMAGTTIGSREYDGTT
ncbi:MAG: hypothetical protein EBV45_11575, partial [Chloroflexi bacterium]|nr:hypothetical protein [Chloroflexota bacterium]